MSPDKILTIQDAWPTFRVRFMGLIDCQRGDLGRCSAHGRRVKRHNIMYGLLCVVI